MLRLIFAFFILNPILSSAQIRPLETASEWEVWYDKVPVSGDIKVGIMEDFNEERLNPLSFFVIIPERKHKSLCVEMSSRDGRYKASRQYNLDRVKPGVNEFVWPTSHKNDLKNYSKQDLIILCSTAEDCDADPEFYSLASWSNDFSSEHFVILLNSEKLPKISISDKSKNTKEVFDCKKLTLSPRITYNCECIIPKKSITKTSEINIVKRVRRINTIKVKQYPFPIRIN